MGKMLRRMLCLLVLMVCCAYGCVSAAESAGSGTQPPKGALPPPHSGLPDASSLSAGTSVVFRGSHPGPGHGTPYTNCSKSENGWNHVKGEDGTYCIPGVHEFEAHPADNKTVNIEKQVTHPGSPLESKHNAPDATLSGAAQAGSAVNLRPQSNGGEQKPHPDINVSCVVGEAPGVGAAPGIGVGPVNGGVPCAAGIPGTVPPPPSTSSVSGKAHNGVPGFPGVHPNVTHTDTAVNHFPAVPPHVNVTVGTPSYARNRGPARPPRADVSDSDRASVEDSESREEVSAPTNTQPEENDNQERNTVAPAQSESAASTRNTPTKVTPPAMPTILQPPTPAKSETKPNKKRKEDSSSISSVWVRVPLLIVAVLFSATVC